MSLTKEHNQGTETLREEIGIIDFTNRYVYGYDPRLLQEQLEPVFNLRLRPQQSTILHWMVKQGKKKSVNVLYKTRDEGASTLIAIYLVYHWLYTPNFSGMVHGKKPNMVDLSSMSGLDAVSLFGKIKLILDKLPEEVLPKTYTHGHAWLKNEDNGSLISGISGGYERITDYFTVNRDPVDVMFFDEIAILDEYGNLPHIAPVRAKFKTLPVSPAYLFDEIPNHIRYLHWIHNPSKNTIKDGKFPFLEDKVRKFRSSDIEREYAPSYLDSVQHIVNYEHDTAKVNKSINPLCFEEPRNILGQYVKNPSYDKNKLEE